MNLSKKILGSALVAVMALGAGNGLLAEKGEGHKHEGKGARMMEKMGLSKEEAKAVGAAKKKHHEAMKPLRDKRRTLMGTLKDQVKAKAADAEISTTIGALEANHKEIETENSRHIAEMKSMLKPMQQAKILLKMKQMMGEGMARHKKWKNADKDDDDDDDDGDEKDDDKHDHGSK